MRDSIVIEYDDTAITEKRNVAGCRSVIGFFHIKKPEAERKCISRTKSTDRHSKPELKRRIRKTKKRCVLFCNKDIIPVEIYVDFFLKRRCPLSILNFFL